MLKERERLEKEFREFYNKDVHFLKDETLEQLRLRRTSNDKDDDKKTECIGICGTQN